MDYAWAQDYPDLYKLCSIFDRTEVLHPKRFIYKPLESYKQKGPQCGIVALAMLTNSPAMAYTVDAIYEYAKHKKFTYQGEIFSVQYMKELAEKFLKDRVIEIHCDTLKCSKVENVLWNGGALLVPYDKDVDNSPGYLNGHSAHWCAVSGIIQTLENIFLLAKHGKSRNVAIWNIEQLDKSNKQLHEVSPRRKNERAKFQIPDGGIDGPMGLNGKCILIYNKT